jgi:hypothetical protein
MVLSISYISLNYLLYISEYSKFIFNFISGNFFSFLGLNLTKIKPPLVYIYPNLLRLRADGNPVLIFVTVNTSPFTA